MGELDVERVGRLDLGREPVLRTVGLGPEGAEQVYSQVRAAGADEDIPFDFDAITRSPNTINAHRIIRWSHSVGLQDQVVPFKTIAVLAEELIRLGKDFDTAFVPGATHAWSREPHYDRYLFGKLIEHFDRHLKPGSHGADASR